VAGGTVLVAEHQEERVSDRNVLVRQIMKEKGLCHYQQASKYIKENNLYKK
jgi:hypothetical protein